LAGIYLHIPFCRRACHYCDFHFSTNTARADEMVEAMLRELNLRKGELSGQIVETIYLGGGTPSLLPSQSIASLLEEMKRLFQVAADAEITLEANPEDLSVEKLHELRAIGVNRLSMGTQSFIDRELQWMNRMHTAAQAERAVRDAQDAGFGNISIDLIFGVPAQTIADWEQNLSTAIGLGIQHISSYGLTVEEKTVLNRNIKRGLELPPDEGIAEQCFRMNMEVLPAHGFEHYEISNFAREGFISRHNSSYWQGVPYLGIGPSAHSFNGTERRWNPRSNALYIKSLKEGTVPFDSEVLTTTDRINEHLMTGLRSKWGVKKNFLDGLDATIWSLLLGKLDALGRHHFISSEERITLSAEGRLLADYLTAALFVDSELTAASA
jgi:oxygen-independent coproporphyrinogen III oxidase